MSERESEWTCGHKAGAMCAECYRELAAKAHALAEENERLRAALQKITDLIDSEADDPLDDAIRIANRALNTDVAGGGQDPS